MWDNALYKDDSTWARNSKIMLNLYNQALKIDPLYTGALSGKASLFNWLGRYDSAMIYYKKVLEIDALDSHTWMGIGMIYQFSNKPDSAYYYFKKGLEHGANDPWDYTLMGQHLLYYMNDVIGALKYYQKGYDAQGGKSAALEWNTMIIFGMIGDYEKAQKYTYKALSQRSECEYIYDYNFLLYNQGKYNEALQFLDSVCSVNACEAYCLASKFYIYTIQKDFAKAEQYYNKYLNAGKIGNVNDTISLVFLASLYKETGRKKEAFSILNEVIRNVEKQLKHMGGWGYMQTKWLLTAAYAILDKNEKVLQYLSELEKTGFLQGSFNLKTFPGFDNLRNDPEFKAIVKRIEDKNAAIRKEVEEMRQRGEITL
jgi:tetratricopeptide (TPR) repeat protein